MLFRSYEYNYYDGKVAVSCVDNLEDIHDVARKFMINKPFVIQQGIDVITHFGNNVDVRILAQRDGGGKWKITGMPVRIASGGCAVTSTHSGASVFTFEYAMGNILHYKKEQISDIKLSIINMINTAVQFIEEEYGTFGELGIDAAIDRENYVWFIEANAKPGKDTIMIAGPEQDITNAFAMPFYYARFISGFPAEE